MRTIDPQTLHTSGKSLNPADSLLPAGSAFLEKRFEITKAPCLALLLARTYRLQAQRPTLGECQRVAYLRMSAFWLECYRKYRFPASNKELPAYLDLTLAISRSVS